MRQKKCAFLFAMNQSLVSAVNCVVQIHETGASDPCKFLTYVYMEV